MGFGVQNQGHMHTETALEPAGVQKDTQTHTGDRWTQNGYTSVNICFITCYFLLLRCHINH